MRLVKAHWAQQGVRNLEAVEVGLREAVFRDLCRVLEELLNDPALPVSGDQRQPYERCHPARPKEVLTLFGPVPLRRNYYYAPAQQAGRFPLDQALGVVDGYSPGVLRLCCRAAARQAYEAAAADVQAFAGLAVQGRQIQRVVQLMGPVIRQAQAQLPPHVHTAGAIPILYLAADGTGLPMVPEALEGRVGKQPDGSAKTREIKLGCAFTQVTWDETGAPLRDYQSTSYVASFAPADQFMVLLRQEAIRRRMAAALILVLLGDGAAWIWEQGLKCFPWALPILDLFHALEHLLHLARLLEPQEAEAKILWRLWREELLVDRVGEVIRQAQQRSSALAGEAAQAARREVGYFERNQSRMLYGTYRAQGLFYGSGVIEAGCKTVIGQRCKQSGMFWSEPGAENVLALRCALQGNQFDQAWDRLHQSDYLRIRVAPQAA